MQLRKIIKIALKTVIKIAKNQTITKNLITTEIETKEKTQLLSMMQCVHH